MAKSARSSVRKRNNAKLRSTVFGPAHDARTERLSAKLQELASLPGPAQQREELSMDVDAEAQSDNAKADPTGAGNDGMDVDMNEVGTKKSSHKKKPSKVERKKLQRKAKNSIVFQKPGQKGGKHRVSKKK